LSVSHGIILHHGVTPIDSIEGSSPSGDRSARPGEAMMGKILIIDDEETIRYAFGSFLADEGHTVVTAGSYEDALAEMARSDFDLYFVDIILGGRSGLEVLREVRERSPASPVVMITGYPCLDTASQAIQRGAFRLRFEADPQRSLLDITERALKHKALVDERTVPPHLAIFRSVQDAIVAVDDRLVDRGERGRLGDPAGFRGCHRQAVHLIQHSRWGKFHEILQVLSSKARSSSRGVSNASRKAGRSRWFRSSGPRCETHRRRSPAPCWS
jgi:CheY-like chemotaxis protein